MSAPKKYVHKDAVVEVIEVTEKNLDDLAEQYGGLVHTSVRTAGLRFLTMEPPTGTIRVQPGDRLLVSASDKLSVVSKEYLEEHYQKA